MKAHEKAIDWALSRGYRCSVHDGEEWAEVLCADKAKIMDAIEAVEVATVNIRKVGESEILATLDVIPYGVGDNETISDFYPATGEFNDWFDANII